MPKGRAWTAEEIELLGQCVKGGDLTYRQMQAQHFPHRSANAVAQAVRKHFEDGPPRRAQDWTTGELKVLMRVLEQHRYDNWRDIARHVPNRTAAACKNAAYKFLVPPSGRRHFLQRDGYMVRKHGPVKLWAAELSKIFAKAFAASKLSKTEVVTKTGASRLTLEHLLAGRRVPRMPIYVRFCEAIGLDAGAALSESIRIAKSKNRGSGHLC